MAFEKIIDVPRLNRFKTKILNLVYKKDEVYNKNEIDNKFSQNAFSKVTVGSTTVAADSKADTLTLVAGSNVTITPDATNDKITIAATDTKYSSKAAVSGGTDVSLVTTGEKATWNAKTSNTGTITQVKANGTNVATSGVANIPAASTSAYGVTKLTSDLTGNSESLAATQKAVNELNSNLKNRGVIISSEKYSGEISAYSFMPETMVLPAGTWLIATSGYIGYNNGYQPFGIGLNDGQKVKGICPSWVVKLDTQSKIYIWNILGETVTAYELVLWAISL